MRIGCRSILSILLVASSIFARQQPQQSTPASDKDDVVRLSVTLVQVDAVVTDKRGRQITDLKPEDFEILEDGRPQQITNFSYVALQPAAAVAPAAVTPAAPASRNSSLMVPPARLSPAQVRRTIALVVDDLALSFGSVGSVRLALKKFVDEQMQPGDLVAIIRTSAGIGALQQFTADKRELYAAIERVRWNMAFGLVATFAPIGGGPITGAGMGSNNMGGNSGGSRKNDLKSLKVDSGIEQFREDVFSVGTLGALNFLVRGLRDLPGRKSVILFSDGIPLYSRDGGNYRVLEAVRRLTDLANRASVVVYSIDARGLQTLGLTAADDTTDLRPDQIEAELQNRRDQFLNSQEGLSYLAQNTGGFFVRNLNHLDKGVSRVLEDQKGYYLIGYSPEEATFKSVEGRRKFHNIVVKVKRSDLRVRSRKGFYGITDEEARPALTTPAQQLMAAITSPFASGDINLRLTSFYGYDQKIGSHVKSLLHLNTRDLSFTNEPDNTHKAVIDLVAFTYGESGRIIDQEIRTDTIRVGADSYEKVLREGIVYSLDLPVKRAGAYQMRIAVRDTVSQRIGSANQFVEVPEIKKGRLALSGIIMSGSAAPVSNAANQIGDPQPAGSVVVKDLQHSPAVRRLRTGMVLDYGFYIYNPQLDRATKRPRLETQVVVFKDGEPVFTGKARELGLVEQSDWKQIAANGRIRLGWNMRPGDYVLQVIVTDKLAKEKYSVSTQWIDFEIVK